MNFLSKLINYFSKLNRDARKFKRESQLRFFYYINNGHLIIEAEFGDFKPSDVADVSDYIALYLSNLSTDYRNTVFVSLMDKAQGNKLLEDTLQIAASKTHSLVGTGNNNKPKRSVTPFNAKI